MGKIIGKVVGSLLGFSLGGPAGALFGYIVGHVHDARAERDYNPWAHATGTPQDFIGNDHQSAFTLGVIVLGAKMAKVDGRVTREEIAAFKRVFNVSKRQEANVGHLFDQARRTPYGYEPYALHLAKMFRHNPTVLEEVLSSLFIIAAADDPRLNEAEMQFLQSIAVIFKFSERDFVRIAARAGVGLPRGQSAAPEDDMYTILGITPETPNDEIKSAYRALIREHHPDKLVAQGMPPELVATATEKMKRINNAYDTICKQKGIR